MFKKKLNYCLSGSSSFLLVRKKHIAVARKIERPEGQIDNFKDKQAGREREVIISSDSKIEELLS